MTIMRTKVDYAMYSSLLMSVWYEECSVDFSVVVAVVIFGLGLVFLVVVLKTKTMECDLKTLI